ncbi:MAG: hypothetical protein DIU62_006735 [Pseudomonadota bacterium]|jgi:hypothetical protein|nr:MAG: hypothetical protein DIU62_01000 [Pseudomonadota bacterium]
MNEPESGDDLRAIFLRHVTPLPEQPFVARVAAQVRAESRRELLLQRWLRIAAAVLLVLASPLLLRFAQWISAQSGSLLARFSEWAGSPPGMAAVAVVVLVVLLVHRWRTQ